MSEAPTSDSSTSGAAPLLNFIDDVFDHGKVDEVEEAFDSVLFKNDHAGYVERKSISALICYAAGYVARKTIAKNAFPQCASCLCVTPNDANRDESLTSVLILTTVSLLILVLPCPLQLS